MKRRYMLLSAALALALTACGASGGPEASEIHGGSPAAEVYEDEGPEAADFADYGARVTGTVVYYDGATLALCSDENRNLQFLVAGEEIDQSGARGLAAGSEADVYYTGGIEGSNTSAAQVTKVEQSPEQAAGTDVSVAGGVITGVDGSELSIMTFDVKALIFSIAGEGIDMEHTNGLTTGDYVTVFYEGEIGDGNGSSVKVVKLVQ